MAFPVDVLVSRTVEGEMRGLLVDGFHKHNLAMTVDVAMLDEEDMEVIFTTEDVALAAKKVWAAAKDVSAGWAGLAIRDLQVPHEQPARSADPVGPFTLACSSASPRAASSAFRTFTERVLFGKRAPKRRIGHVVKGRLPTSSACA